MKTQGFNYQTGEVTDRDMTPEEMADMETLPKYDIPKMEWPDKEETPTE